MSHRLVVGSSFSAAAKALERRESGRHCRKASRALTDQEQITQPTKQEKREENEMRSQKKEQKSGRKKKSQQAEKQERKEEEERGKEDRRLSARQQKLSHEANQEDIVARPRVH